MTPERLSEIIAGGETLVTEFKSDRTCLPDRELVEAVVAMANTDGGVIIQGVEDKTGAVTGLHRKHIDNGTPAAMIANRTVPSLHVHVSEVMLSGHPVFAIEVPRASGLVGSTDGYYASRRLKMDGAPENVPMNPFEIQQRLSQLRLVDFSGQPMPEVPLACASPLQRERMRAAIRRNVHSDKTLLDLSDGDFDKALGLVRDISGRPMLTLSGVLFLTDEATIREHVPTYELAFQVLSGTGVLVNEFTRKPIVEAFDDFELRFRARIEEREVMRGLFRMAVPTYDPVGFREALVNAIVHRDYARLGTVVVRLDESGLTVSNPGGFVEGVTLDNFLTVEPRPRNPLLADIAKRIGLAERTGRGIDRIFEGTLRFGRPCPDYARTSATSVVLFIANAEPDFAFLDMLNEEESKTGKSLPFESLVALSALRDRRRLSAGEIAKALQRSPDAARACLESLVERGLVETQGRGPARVYLLGASVYRRAGKDVEYVRQAGMTRIEQEQMVLKLARQKSRIRRKDVMELCRIEWKPAYSLLQNLVTQGELRRQGSRGTAFYELPGQERDKNGTRTGQERNKNGTSKR